jgi:hypothetical protein
MALAYLLDRSSQRDRSRTSQQAEAEQELSAGEEMIDTLCSSNYYEG